MLPLLKRASHSAVALTTERKRICEPYAYAPAVSKTKQPNMFGEAKCPVREALVLKRSIAGCLCSNLPVAVMSPQRT